MKVAVYSCNFGNYRGETRCVKKRNEGKIDAPSVDQGKEFHYYYFTDDENLTLNNWTVIHQPLVEEDLEIMDANRWTNKHLKFNLPEILSSYDVVIWMDSSYFCHPERLKLYFNLSKIKNLFSKGIDVLMVKHQIRKTVKQELEFTISRHVENREAGGEFLEEIKDIEYLTALPQANLFIRRTDEETNKLFEHVYFLHKNKKLKRDQNLFNYAVHKTNYPVEKILFTPWATLIRQIF